MRIKKESDAVYTGLYMKADRFVFGQVVGETFTSPCDGRSATPTIKTKRSVRAGNYGIINVGAESVSGHKIPINIKYLFYTAEQLREAAHILNQIAEILEDE